MKHIFISLAGLLLLFLLPACGNVDADTTGMSETPEPARDLAAIRPPAIEEYCEKKPGNVMANPSVPPEPFLYQPFVGVLDGKVWSSQMDHDQPTYGYQPEFGVIATLGESLRYDTQQPVMGFQGGTQVYIRGSRDPKWFSRDISPADLFKKGYSALAYESPFWESYLYYDGHDGHDFAITGNAVAAAAGEVAFVGDYGDTLGRVVEIYHPQGYLTRYAHLGSFSKGLEVGQEVKAGDPLGKIGGSAVVKGIMEDDFWGVHLHFSVFRWSSESKRWEVTDPFGWDPWAGVDEKEHNVKQLEDPLFYCNGEVSYNLWVGNWPQPSEGNGVATDVSPTQDRYVGGWLGDAAEVTEDILSPLDRGDSASVVQWIQCALTEKDISVFERLILGDEVRYVGGMEGVKPVTKQQFLDDLLQRLPSNPQCERFLTDQDGNLTQVWISGWAPLWELDYIVYAEKIIIDPPHTSDVTGLFFESDGNGFYIKSVWLNTYEEDLWEQLYGMLSSPCGAPDAVNPDTLTNAQYPDSIAYEYDGDLWLIELDSLRKSRLTADGNNRYPAWSADGRYLVYEHFSGNKTDLRILDVQAKKDWLFQSNACCAAWSPEGNALAFFSHDNYDFEMAYLDASDATSQLCCGNWVGTAPFAAPDTPMFWSADNWLYIPGLDPPSSRRIQVYDMESTGFSWLTVPDRNSCFYALSKAPDQGLLAVTQDKSCTLTPDNPQVVIMDDNGVWHELPTASSSYLSWSTDGTWVAYEGSALRCAVSPCPYGINILNMDTLENRLIVEGGAQPAWRPLCK